MIEEFIIRPGIFVLVLVLILSWEWARPFLVFPEAKLRRLCRHLWG
jgi:hypothetical protein